MSILPVVLFPLLYAETHYRFKYFFSFLKKSEPEILADIPHRLEPGAALPILIVVKDANLYPVELNGVRLEISYQGRLLFAVDNCIPPARSIKEPLWWKIVPLPLPDSTKNVFGFIDVDVFFDYSVAGKHRSCKNDNYRTSSKKSLRIYRSQDPLPSISGWFQGDTHTHSSYTDDQVEFGAPLEASARMCKAMGLSFFCVTDHSYDLDDKIDDYLTNDPGIPKWKSLQEEVDNINSRVRDFVIIRGEEVSCFNRAQRNIHLLLWGTRKFFAGSGDSAEKWFRTTAEHSIVDVLSKKDDYVVAYAGHPTEPAPFFQRLFIKRGEWTLDDMNADGLAGIQILNGEAGKSFSSGLACWTKLLLSGKRIFIAAGNDAHGNFNRFKQIGIPFFTIREEDFQLFGAMRTAVQSESLDEASLLTSLRCGHSVVTNGPLLIFEILNERGDATKIGGATSGVRLQLHVEGITSREYGSFELVRIILGRVGSENEIVFGERHITGLYSIDLNIRLDINTLRNTSYVRLEGCTKNASGRVRNGFCYTNPIWILSK